MSILDEIIVGTSTSINQIRMTIEHIRDSNATVVISGEPGSGRNLVASTLYQLSTKYNQGFMRFDCAATSDGDQLERELFGYVSGAFPEARETRRGFLRSTDHCTVVFENFDEAPLHFQAKLLRFMELRDFSPIGSTQIISVDCKVLSTTTGFMRDRMSAGLLRPDLYYRFDVVRIEIPPLRERPEDLRPLICNFVTRLGKDPSSFLGALKKQGLLRFFEQYSWPGNVGELKNMVDTLALGEKWDDIRDILRARSQISAHLSVQRVIEFLPEYHQAGISILSFFGEVLRRKYSNYKGVVRIEQDGLKVRMIIEPVVGELEIFEQALDEYGLIVSGKITAEQFTDDPYLVMSLKHELRLAQARIESQKELLSYQHQRLDEKERVVTDFMRMIGQTLAISKTPDVRIEVSPRISADIRTNFNASISVDVITENLTTLGQVLASIGDKRDEIDQIRNELELLKSKNANSFKRAPVMTKLRKLINQISEAESNVGKLLKTAEAGVSTVQTIAKYYNDIAAWCGLPQVPKPLLGNSEKS